MSPAATPSATTLWTAEQLAERWQVPVTQIYRLARERRVPVVAVGRYYRFSPAAIEAWEGSGGATADAGRRP